MAAELCPVAQPVLSRHIAALEAKLNIELCERSKKRVHLTEAEREFAVYGVTFLPPSMTRSSLSAELVALPVVDL